jgi:hypothetical protein
MATLSTASNMQTVEDVLAAFMELGVNPSPQLDFASIFKNLYLTLSASERAELVAALLAKTDQTLSAEPLMEAA